MTFLSDLRDQRTINVLQAFGGRIDALRPWHASVEGALMIYVIGPLELDACRRELYGDGHTAVKITEKAVDVLLALLERHGDWVTRNELLQEVWAGASVSENVLAQRLKEIRECLE